MTLPLTGATLTGYNNLPAIPPTAPLGNLLNELYGDLSQYAWAVTFRPGDPNPAPGVYTTWPEVFAAASATAPLRRIIVVDSSFAPAVVTPGVWNFSNEIDLSGTFGLVSQLTVGPGATFVDLGYITQTLDVVSTSNAPVIVIGNGESRVLVFDSGSTIQAQGTAPFVTVDVNGFFALALRTASALTGASPVVQNLDASAGALVVLLPASTVGDVIAGPGTLIEFWQGTALNIAPQTGFTGTLVIDIQTAATHLGYTPSTPADWALPAPITAQEAMDRLASALAIAIGGPIP